MNPTLTATLLPELYVPDLYDPPLDLDLCRFIVYDGLYRQCRNDASEDVAGFGLCRPHARKIRKLLDKRLATCASCGERCNPGEVEIFGVCSACIDRSVGGYDYAAALSRIES